MSLLRGMRARRPRGVPVTGGRLLMASALVLLTALLLLRVPVVAITRDRSEVCVGPVPVGGPCTTSTTTTTTTSSVSSSTTTEWSAVSTSTTGSENETTASAAELSTGGAPAPLTAPAPTGHPAAASHFPPPPPPLPPASPGSAPVAADAVVQRIVMVPAAPGRIAPGDTVEVQATLEAQRGTDIFAVPHVPVVFTLVAASGGGATVIPAQVSSGDSGVALVRVRTADLAGDTVVSATSGTASAQLALHTDLPLSAAARVAPPDTGGASPGSGGGHRLAWAGVLAAAGVLGAAALGLARRQRSGISV
jgi:hypothetical protein